MERTKRIHAVTLGLGQDSPSRRQLWSHVSSLSVVTAIPDGSRIHTCGAIAEDLLVAETVSMRKCCFCFTGSVRYTSVRARILEFYPARGLFGPTQPKPDVYFQICYRTLPNATSFHSSPNKARSIYSLP
jgi:hypothetical protein